MTTDPSATTGPLDVLYEDAHVLAVSKPAGLLTQGTANGAPTLEQAVRRHLSATREVYVGTVHRLDRPVSGVVVWAKTAKAARRLAEEFATRATVKEYWAIVETQGSAVTVPAPALDESGVWDDRLARSTNASGVVAAVGIESVGACRAITRYRVDRANRLPGGMLWMRLWPETGRTHQLRAQSSLRRLPIWGDTTYGASHAFSRGIALHAHALTFRHPVLRKEMTVIAPPPVEWFAQGIVLT